MSPRRRSRGVKEVSTALDLTDKYNKCSEQEDLEKQKEFADW